MSFWVTFEDGSQGCVELLDKAPQYPVEQDKKSWIEYQITVDNAVKTLAQEITGKIPVYVKRLPYPANPRLGKQSNCPAFCYSPKQCAGHSSCPKSYACSE